MRLSPYKSVLLLCAVCFFSTVATAQSTNRAQLIAEIDTLHHQMKEKEAALLAPAPEDRSAFADFLKQPETGLFRLLPREKYDNKLSIRGGGAYYSFKRLTHEYGYGSDISLEQGALRVGFAGQDFGFFLMLGDVPLEAVNLETAGVPYLAQYNAPTDVAGMRINHIIDREQDGDFFYKRTIPALVGRTYVLRSIDYGEADTLVALRVVRQDTDGSLVILWKMLKKYPVPISRL